jgi:hypothetical protein
MSTYSPDLRIELIDSGAQAGTWGTTTNNTFAYLLEAAIAGYQTVSVTSANQALTYINGASSTAGDNQSVYAMLRFTTTTGAAFSVYAPPTSKQYIIYNNSGYTATIYNSTTIGNTTAAGTGVAILNGNKVMVWSDGTNFYEVQAQNLTGTLAIANGGTGQTSANAAFNALAPAQTANRLLRSDGTNTSFAQVALATDVTGTLPVANGGTGVTTAAAITALVGNLLYPVGSMYFNATSGTNPATLLGFGTWAAAGVGRVLIGVGSLGGNNFTAGASGGAFDATLPAHTHTISDPTHAHTSYVPYSSSLSAGPTGFLASAKNAPDYAQTTSFAATGITGTNSAGVSPTNANLPPYAVVYMWQRTA